MALLTVQRSPSASSIEDDLDGEEENVVKDLVEIETPKRAPKLGRMRSPSFEGYFASKSGAFALSNGNLARSESTKTCGELQFHLQRMVTLLRTGDALKMAVRLESQIPRRKRYLALVTSSHDSFSAILGIDWVERPTIGLILPIFSSSTVTLDGDGGFHIKSDVSHGHMFKPVSVQMLWSAIHVTYKAIELARRFNYFSSGQTNELVSHYNSMLRSDSSCITEWNLLEGVESRSSLDLMLSDQEEAEIVMLKKLITQKLREVMMKVDLDDITAREIRMRVEEELNMDLREHKGYVDEEMLTILGQMDSASKIMDYLYLGSEWNASYYDELMEIGIGYVLNVTREIDNFFPGSFVYYNVRVEDVEESDLLHHWDHTYRFINQAREAGSKVLVHCRMGISRSASTVIAYLMKCEGWCLTQCIEHVRNCRSIIQPNPGFQKQLIIYEGILNSSRNRYSALFRQRSKSDLKRPSSVERKRQMFRKSRSSKEAIENNGDNDMEEENYDVKSNVGRPMSWCGTPSAKELTGYVEWKPEKSKEKVSLNGIKEDQVNREGPTPTETMEVDSAKGKNVETDEEPIKKDISVQRAKTLPLNIFEADEDQEEEGGDFIGELPQVEGRYRRGHLKRQVTDEDLDSLISKDVKEENESLMKQASMACEIKNKLMRSLEQVGRVTKHKMDEEFSVESIIKPSSLRKLSKTRRLSIERRQSLTEQDRPSASHRPRAQTEVLNRSPFQKHNPPVETADGKQKSFTLPRPSKRAAFVQPDEGIEIKPLDFNDSDVTPEKSPLVGDDNCKSNGIAKKKESRYKAFLRRSKTNIKEDSRRRTLDEKQLRKGLGELFKSHDMEQQVTIGGNKENLVVEDSQFTTVEDSKKQIEERVRQNKIRNIRSPRRRTVGSSELFYERNKNEFNTISGDLLSSLEITQTQLNTADKNDKTSFDVNSVGNDDLFALPSPGRVRRNARNYEAVTQNKNEVIMKDKEGGTTDEDKNEATLFGRNNVCCEQETGEIFLENKNSECKDALEDELTVRELVKFHSNAIRQKSTSPSSSSSPTEEEPFFSLGDTGETKDTDTEGLCAGTSEENVSESQCASQAFGDSSLKDLDLKGIVKRQAEVFTKVCTNPSVPGSKRCVRSLPRMKRNCITTSVSFDHPVHKTIIRVKSLPLSKSEIDMDSEVDAILSSSESVKKEHHFDKLITSGAANQENKNLQLPEEEICSMSAPASPTSFRGETLDNTLKGRASSLESLPLDLLPKVSSLTTPDRQAENTIEVEVKDLGKELKYD